jgi:hypothetical protein
MLKIVRQALRLPIQNQGWAVSNPPMWANQASSGLSTPDGITDTHDMITKNIGMLLLAIYLIVVGIVTLTGLGIGIVTAVLALLAGIFILIGR